MGRPVAGPGRWALGIKEKVLAAQRAGVKTVIFPNQNQVDIDNLEPEVKEGLEIATAAEIKLLVDLVLLPEKS